QPRPAVVAADLGARPSQPGQQAEAARIAAEQLEAAVRRELLGNELDGQISLDHPPQAAYAQAHQRGLRELRDDMGMSALWIRWKAPLIHTDLALTPSVFSDWGTRVPGWGGRPRRTKRNARRSPAGLAGVRSRRRPRWRPWTD